MDKELTKLADGTELELSSPYRFYNGTEVLRFCTKKNGKPAHEYYRVLPDGFELQDGVTTISGILDKSFYLMPWATKMMALDLLDKIPTNEGRLVNISIDEFSEIVNKAKTAHKDAFEDAGDVGDMAHKWLELSIQSAISNNNGIVEQLDVMAPLDPRAISCGEAAFKWMQAHNVRWIASEKKIYSRKYRYAGTCDGLATIDSCEDPKCCARMFIDELSLIDWKSSNQLNTDYLYQTAAYQQAETEESGRDIKSRWILRLGKEDGKFYPWYELDFELDFAAFLHCLNLRRTHKAVEKRMSDAKKLKTFYKREEKKKEKENEKHLQIQKGRQKSRSSSEGEGIIS